MTDDKSVEEYRLGMAESGKRVVREDSAMLMAALEAKCLDAQGRIEQACFWAVQMRNADGAIVGSFESLAEILKGEPQ